MGGSRSEKVFVASEYRTREFSLTTNEMFRTQLQVRLTDGLRLPQDNIKRVGGNLIHRRRCANETFAHSVILLEYGEDIRVFEYWVILRVIEFA
jgi:hypothetical protein